MMEGKSPKTRFYVGLTFTCMVLALTIYAVTNFSSGSQSLGPEGPVFVGSNKAFVDANADVEFPAYVRSGNRQHLLTLLGAGTAQNSTNFFNCSISMYMEANSARQELEQFRGLSAPEILSVQATHIDDNSATKQKRNDQLAPAYFKFLEQANGDRAVKMTLTQEIPVFHAHYLFGYALLERLQTKNASPSTQARVMQRFLQAFNETLVETEIGRKNYLLGDELMFTATFKEFYFYFEGTLIALIDDEPTFSNWFMGIFLLPWNPTRSAFADRAPLLWLHGELFLGLTEWGLDVPTQKFYGLLGAGNHPYNMSLALWGTTYDVTYVGETMHEVQRLAFWLRFTIAVGFYMDAEHTEEVLAPLLTSGADSDELLAAIANATHVTRGFRLFFNGMQGATATHVVRDALMASMESILYREIGGTELLDLSNPASLPPIPESVSERVRVAKDHFRLIFNMTTTFKKEDRLHLMCDSQERLIGVFNQATWRVITTDSPALCKALFESYLGAESVVGKDRAQFIKGALDGTTPLRR